MPERTGTPDTVASHERVQFYEGLVGLQARLLIGGEALNPNKLDLPAVTQDALGDMAARNYSPFVAASMRERKRVTKTKQESINDFVLHIEAGKPFFQKDQEGRRWNQLFLTLGINTQKCTYQDVEAFYKKYLYATNIQSNIKQFIQDVVTAHKNSDGQIDYQKLKQNLDGIQWLANLFGEVSSEIISQLVDTEVKLQTNPESLIKPANESKDNTLRINNLLPKEKELLEFLTESKTQAPSPQPTVEKGKEESEGRRIDDFLLTYFRPSEPRIFPERFSAYELLAQEIKVTYPSEFAADTVQTLSKRIEKEMREIQKDLDDYGLTSQELHNLTFKPIEETVLKSYRTFIQNTYGVTLPTTEKLQIIPLKGVLSRLINPQRTVLAFVTTTAPFIFLDFDVIERAAEQKAYKQGWRVMKTHEFAPFLKSLLAEIQPHEYTHLLADLAYWNFYHLDPQDREKLAKVIPERVGLQLTKVKNLKRVPQGLAYSYLERGRGLMEALTVELTAKWADIQKVGPLDIPAYAGEREILYELQNMLFREEGMHEDESLKKFVQGYFTRHGFRHLVETLDGHTKVNDKTVTKRPHLTSIACGLMEYEASKYQNTTTPAAYPLTYYFLQKRLSHQQKQEILSNLDRIYLAPAVKEELRKQMI